MQCPAHHLDYVYSQSTDPDASNFCLFFAGKNKISVLAIPNEDYLADFKRDGRGVKQYELNLTHHEKQRLWQLLDNSIMRDAPLNFDMLNENCVNMTMLMLERCLINEQFDAGELPEQMLLSNGEIIRYHSAKSPWAEFLFITFAGTACDGSEALERKLSPEFIVPVLQGATFVSNDGYRRPVLTGEVKELLPQLLEDRQSALTPTMVFAMLFGFIFVITLLEWIKGWHTLANVTDAVLFVVQTFVGILLTCTTFVSSLFGTHWNWYLIPFCPLAIVLWFAFRRRKAVSTIYLLFTIILIIFLLLTPMSSQLDLPHQLITATFAVRTASNYLNVKKIAFNI